MGNVKNAILSDFNLSFVEENLMQNEKIIFATKESSVLYYTPIGYLLISLACLFFQMVFWFGMAGVLFSGIYFAGLYVNVNSSLYVVTSKRIFVKSGFLQRTSIEFPLSKVESIQLSQSLLGRMFNFGSIKINGVGGDSGNVYLLSNPLEFKKAATQTLDTVN